MITSNHILSISEKYFDSKNVSGHNLEIYENPTPDEIVLASKITKKELGKGEIRFFAINTSPKRVFAFDAYHGSHYEVAPKLGLSPSTYNPQIIMATAIVNGKKAVMDTCDPISIHLQDLRTKVRDKSIEYFNTLFSIDWSWADKYIEITKYLNNKKRDFDKMVKK